MCKTFAAASKHSPMIFGVKVTQTRMAFTQHFLSILAWFLEKDLFIDGTVAGLWWWMNILMILFCLFSAHFASKDSNVKLIRDLRMEIVRLKSALAAMQVCAFVFCLTCKSNSTKRRNERKLNDIGFAAQNRLCWQNPRLYNVRVRKIVG